MKNINWLWVIFIVVLLAAIGLLLTNIILAP